MATQTQTPPQPSKPIPFVKGRPLLGNLSAYNSERLDLLLRITQECGDVGGMHFGPFPLLIFNTSDYVHAIFVEHAYDFDKGVVIHSTFRPVIGNGLFISEGDVHRKQRKLIAPSFQPRHLAGYADSIVGYGERMQREWHDGQLIDVNRQMTALKLPYCLQVFKETLRLYPPAYAISRQALKDITIDGYLVRKGQSVAILPYALHRRPDYFPDPERFDPDRFTHEHEQLLPRYAFVPFGAGPRICIGNYFAMMEGQLLLATLAQRVSFELASPGSVEPDPYHTLAIRPRGGLPVIVKRRERQEEGSSSSVIVAPPPVAPTWCA